MNRKTKIYTIEQSIKQMYPNPSKRRKFMKEVRAEMGKLEVEYQEELSCKLQKARVRSGISQSELAYRLGTQKTAISRLESGRQNITVATLVRTCHAMGATCKLDIKKTRRS